MASLRSPSTLLAALVIAAPLCAQNRVETFPYPNGNLIPGWTSQAGSWSIQNGMVKTNNTTWSYLTIDAFPNIGNCVIDTLCVYPTSTGVHFVGAVARHPGTGSGNYLMSKIQDNSSAGNWNSLWIYERPSGGTTLSTTPTTSTKRMWLRTVVQGTNSWCELDMDMDGIFEQKTGLKVLTAAVNAEGLTGLSGYNQGMIDEFRLFQAVLTDDGSSAPKIGTTYNMVLDAPQRVVGNVKIPTPWLGMLAAGNQGIPLPDGRRIPLSFDPIFANSFSFGWSGVISTATPTGKMSLSIPNDANFVGLRLYGCGVTLGGPGSFGIASISNDHQFMIQS